MTRREPSRRRLRRAGAMFLFWLTLGACGAQAACPGEGGEEIPGDPDVLARLNDELTDLAAACGKSAAFLAYRGAVLLALGRASEAAAQLELALLYSPDQPVAQIDYARALTQLGDLSSAAALWRSLLARADLPPHLRGEIEARLGALARIPAESAVWRHRREVSLRVGYDSNLNSASSAQDVTLTYPGLEVTLPILPAAQPVDGAAAWMDARWQASRAFAGQREVDVRAELRLRGSHVSGVSFRQADVEANGHQRVAGGLWTLSAGAGDVVFGGAHLTQTLRGSLLRSWIGTDCAHRAGVETEWRQYPSNRELEGRYLGVSAAFGCRAIGPYGFSLVARAGMDEPVHTRAGGGQTRADARAQVSRAWGDRTLQAALGWQGSRDREGYSPLLGGGARRSIDRLTFNAEWTQPVYPGWLGVAALEVLQQRSNLALFALRGSSIQVGVKRVW